MRVALRAVLALLSVAAAARAGAYAPTSAIVGGLETSLLDERQQLDESGAGVGAGAERRVPTTARLERVYSSSGWHRRRATAPSRAPPPPAPASSPAPAPALQPASAPRESYARTGNRLHVTPAEADAQSGNPAPCTVGGRHFLHGQQVTRRDPCEFCMCLDGEVFCWWQDCPPSSAQGPCRGLPPFTACEEQLEEPAAITTVGVSGNATSAAAAAAGVTVSPAASTSDSTATSGSSSGSSTLASSPQALTQGSGAAYSAVPAGGSPAPEQEATETDAASTTTVATSTEIMCHVLGSTYRVGEVLPRDTGSCLQCECSPEGRVTCSPKDCLSVREEEDVYQPASSLDMFDVDSF